MFMTLWSCCFDTELVKDWVCSEFLYLGNLEATIIMGGINHSYNTQAYGMSGIRIKPDEYVKYEFFLDKGRGHWEAW